MKRWMWIALGAVVLAGIGAGVWLARGSHDGLARIRNAGTMRVGYAVEAPYAIAGPSGEVSGEAPTTARLIASRLGIAHIEWVQLPFRSLIPDLEAHRIDMIAAGIFITRARTKRVRFSEPTLRVRQGLLVPAGNPKRLTGFSTLVPREDLKLAVIAGSVEESRLRARGFGEGLLTVPDSQAARAMLAQGLADAVALSLPTVRWMSRASGGAYEFVAEADTPQHRADTDVTAFAFNLDDELLATAWNRAEREVVGTPEHLEAIAPFGFGRDDLARSAQR